MICFWYKYEHVAHWAGTTHKIIIFSYIKPKQRKMRAAEAKMRQIDWNYTKDVPCINCLNKQ